MLRYTLRNTEIHPFPRPEGMPEALHALLVGRGVSSAAEAEAFLNPGRGNLLDPFLLSGMEAAARRVRAAMDAGEVICVYGDYDVDGVCASTILSGWLKSAGADARVYLPSRHSEGYGLNEEAIRGIAGWAKLMVTVDCGVTSVELVALAQDLGLDVVVTDHHRPPEGELPACPVVNPLLGGYPFPFLCGAGVAWKLVWALGGEAAAMPWVDVAALATVADVVPLTGENRAIVKLGLDAINNAPRRPGLEALIETAGVSGRRITSTDIAFMLAPRLNAGGRLGSANRSLALISEADPAKAREQAAELESENTRRKSVEQEILKGAEAQLEGFDFPSHRALVLAGKDWNPGVIGLAASRLVEKYNYPVVMLSGGGEFMTGSCRSIEGVDIHAALTGCAETLVKFGGHRQAAGLTLRSERLEDFRRALDAWLRANVDPMAYVPVRQYDAQMDFGHVTPGLIAALDGLQPTGFGNPAPLFRASASVIEARAVGAEGAHLKLTLAQDGHRLGGIAFREGARAGELGGGVDALFAVKLNTYMGRTEPQLELKALADADVFERLRTKLADEPRMVCDFLTQIFYNKKIPCANRDIRETDAGALRHWLSECPQGTLLLAGDIACAGRLMRLAGACPPDLYLGALPRDPRAFNAVCVLPAGNDLPKGYDRLVLAGLPEEWLPPDTAGAEVLRLAEPPGWLRQLPELDDMRAVYRALMRVLRRPAWCRTLWQLCRMAAEEAGLGEVCVAASILAMADMGVFHLTLDEGSITLSRGESPKVNPEDGAAWRTLRRWRETQLH